MLDTEGKIKLETYVGSLFPELSYISNSSLLTFFSFTPMAF